MKVLISLVMAAFVLGFIFTADLVAEKPMEKKLKADGWIRVIQKPMDNADTTWYGQEGSKTSGHEKRVLYIGPTGKKAYFQYNKGGETYTGKREVAKDGTHCIQFDDFFRGKSRCGRTLWKKGNLYQILDGNGYPSGTIWAIKKGNLENIK